MRLDGDSAFFDRLFFMLGTFFTAGVEADRFGHGRVSTTAAHVYDL
jgi:hypothetical protein